MEPLGHGSRSNRAMNHGTRTALAVLFSAASVHAAELSPDLRLPPLGAEHLDITRRPEARRSTTVRSRPRPELQPLGIRMGSFHLTTELGLPVGYTDNLFAAESRTASDFHYGLAPRVELRSGWSRHAWRVGAHSTHRRHREFSSEDYDDWQIFADGRLDFGAEASLFSRLSIAQRHEGRGAANSFSEGEIAEYHLYELNGGWSQPFGRFAVRLTGGLAEYQFDAINAGEALPIDVDDRDRVAAHAEARLGYQVQPGYRIFLRSAYNRQRYDHPGGNGVNRDSSGIEYSLGADLEITELLFGDVFAGYYRQRYDDPSFDDRDGLGLGANLYWNPTTLTTVHLEVGRSVQETILAGTAGYLATDTAVELEHELLRNLLLFAGARHLARDYSGVGREETMRQYHLAAHYQVNRHLSVRWRVVYRDQDGKGGGRDFTQTAVEQHIVLQF